MTSDKDDHLGDDPGGKSSSPKKPSSAGRRPAPTIELKATEVANEKMADEPSNAAKSDDVVPDVTVKAEQPQSNDETGAGSAPPQEPDPSRSSAWGRLPGGLSWPLIGTAAAAGAVFFLLGLAAANLLVGRDVPADAALDRTQTVDALSGRLTKIETALTAPRAPDTALIGRIASAEAAAKLATENAAIQQRRAEELAALVRETRSRADAAAEAAQKGAGVATADGVRVDVDALHQRIAALEQTLKSNEAELARRNASAADDRKSRVAVVASVLLGAVERGTSFTAELAAAKTLAADNAALAPLESFAASGVPSAAAVSRELSVLTPAMLKILDSETRVDGSFLEKLQANAERLVRIRPVGDVSGDRPLDVMARVEAKAASSDIAGALADLSKLPPQVRAPAEGWIAKANARNGALAAARQFSAGAVAAIGKPNT